MCTAILKKEYAKGPKIAKADMVVYKVTDVNFENIFGSKFRDYTYRPNELHTATFSIGEEVSSDDVEYNYIMSFKQRHNAFNFISTGLHAYISIARIKMNWYNIRRLGIGRFIIPKGAQYYKNACGNIVSNQIIFKEFVK